MKEGRRKGERGGEDRTGSSQASESTASSQPTQETPKLVAPSLCAIIFMCMSAGAVCTPHCPRGQFGCHVASLGVSPSLSIWFEKGSLFRPLWFCIPG